MEDDVSGLKNTWDDASLLLHLQVDVLQTEKIALLRSLNCLRLMGKDESSELIDQLEPVVYCIKYLQVGACDDSCTGSSAFAAKAHSLQKNLCMDLGCASLYAIYFSTREPSGNPWKGYL